MLTEFSPSQTASTIQVASNILLFLKLFLKLITNKKSISVEEGVDRVFPAQTASTEHQFKMHLKKKKKKKIFHQ